MTKSDCIRLEPINLSVTSISLILELHKSTYPKYLLTAHFPDGLLRKYYLALLDDVKYSYFITYKGETVGLIIGLYKNNNMQRDFILPNLLPLLRVMIKNKYFIIKKFTDIITKKEVFKSHYNFRFVNLLIDNQKIKGLCSKTSKRSNLALIAVSRWEKILMDAGIKSYGHSIDIKNLPAINFHIKNGCRVEKIHARSIFMYKDLS